MFIYLKHAHKFKPRTLPHSTAVRTCQRRPLDRNITCTLRIILFINKNGKSANYVKFHHLVAPVLNVNVNKKK